MIIFLLFIVLYMYTYLLQWGQKVFSQPLIVQVLLLRIMREVCNFHHFNYERQNEKKINQAITL